MEVMRGKNIISIRVYYVALAYVLIVLAPDVRTDKHSLPIKTRKASL